jgi:arabinofuranosyltransferase
VSGKTFHWRALRERFSLVDAFAWCALLLVSVLAYRHALQFRDVEIDDAFITFRYADNLAHGHGFVFNPGERVEGTSTFLYTLALSLGAAARVDLLALSRVFGALSLISLVIFAYAFVRLLVPDRGSLLGVAAGFLVASATPLAFYSLSGMETVTWAAVLLAGLYLHVRAMILDASPRPWALVMGFAALMRPEGFAFFFLVLALSFTRDVWRGSPSAMRRAAASLPWFAAAYAPLVVFRVAYFRALIPNSVTAKASLAAAAAGLDWPRILELVWNGPAMTSAADFLKLLGLGAFLLLPALLSRPARYGATVLLTAAALAALTQAWSQGDWMPYFRFLVPAVAPLAITMMAGLRALLFHPAQRLRGGHVPSMALAVGAAAWIGAQLHYDRAYRFPHVAVNEHMKSVGRGLSIVKRDDDLLATDMAGFVPYYSGLRTLDLLGLCDAHIGRFGTPYGVMGKTDWSYAIQRRPTFYQLNSLDWAKRLFQHPTFIQQGDQYWAVLTPFYLRARGGDRKLLLVRKDRPDLDALTKALGATLVDSVEELRRQGSAP